jgi:hypothetical protein
MGLIALTVIGLAMLIAWGVRALRTRHHGDQ